MATELNDIDYIQEDGKPLFSRVVNQMIDGINAINQWIRNFEADHPEGLDISQARVVGLRSTYEFDGEDIMPSVILYFAGKRLEQGVHFIADYRNNDRMGTATVTYLGLTPYIGELTKTFAIEGRKYNISYTTEHGTAPATHKVSFLTSSDIPELTDVDYTLLGWFDDNGKQYHVGDILNEDAHLTAHWQAKTFTLTYDSAHGTVVQPTGKVSALPPSLPNPNAEGYYFAGWFYANGTKANGNDILREDTTLYAKWVNTAVYFDIHVDDTTHASTLTFSAEEQTEDVTIEYSEDGGDTWQEPTLTPIALNETKSYRVRLKYDGTVIATSADATITAVDDNDEHTLTFTSTNGTVLNAAKNEAIGTLDLSTDRGTYNITDGVTNGVVIISNN